MGGIDLGWSGKQDNPKLRQQMTEELVILCKDMGWEHEVLSPRQTFTTIVEPPYWYMMQHNNPMYSGNPETNSPSDQIEHKFIGEKDITEYVYKIPNPLKGKIFEVAREGVIIYPYGTEPDFITECSFAFILGKNLPFKLQNNIATQPERFHDGEKRNDHFILHGDARMNSNAAYGLCKLMTIIKRLWVPGLTFDAEGIDEQAKSIAENFGMFLTSGKQVLALLRSSKFRDQLAKLTSFAETRMNVGNYPKFWDRYCSFIKHVGDAPIPDLEALTAMMNNKYANKWLKVSIAALLFTPGNVHEFLRNHDIRDLGTLCERGKDILMCPYPPSVEDMGKNEIDVNLRKALWFLADPQTDIDENEIIGFVENIPETSPKTSPVAAKEKVSDPVPHIIWNDTEHYEAILSDISCQMNAMNPKNIMQFFNSIDKIDFSMDVSHKVIWHDGIAIAVKNLDAIFFYNICDLWAGLPVVEQMFQVDPEPIYSTRDDFIETFMPLLYTSKDEIIITGCGKELRSELFRSVISEWNIEYREPPEEAWKVSYWIKEKHRDWYFWKGLLINVQEHVGEDKSSIQMSVCPFTVYPEIIKYIHGWKYFFRFSELCNPLNDYFSPLTTNRLKRLGFQFLADLVQVSYETIIEMLKKTPGKGVRSIEEIRDVFGKKEDFQNGRITFGMNLKEDVLGPASASRWWPMANHRLCADALCRGCIYNEKSEDDRRICILRNQTIRNEHEEFCLSFCLHEKIRKKPDNNIALGPVFRMFASGTIGFRPYDIPDKMKEDI